jgi:two-component system, NarL family, response regulator LiaR
VNEHRPGGSAGTGHGFHFGPQPASRAAEAAEPAEAARPDSDVAQPPGPGTGTSIVKIVIVEDHALVREGTAELLQRDPGLQVLGQAGTAEEALELVSDLRPDIALVDVELPGMNGIALARTVADQGLPTRVLILSAYDDYAYVIGALEAGVAGYLLKTSSAQELAAAVRTAAGGALVLDEALSRRLTRRWRTGPGETSPALTAREAEVLRLIARGLPNKQIASQLGLGLRTVESHVSSLLGKLGVSSRTEAALYAVSHQGASRSSRRRHA